MKIQSKAIRKFTTVCLALVFAFSTLGLLALAAPAEITPQAFYDITNPYANVDWASFGQYKAAHHTHSTYSDGSNTRRDMLIDKYNKGFDIVAMTDHDTTTGAWDTLPDPANRNWNNIGTAILSAEATTAIRAGTYDASGFAGTFTGRRQQDNGMIGMGFSNEITAGAGYAPGVYGGHHINSFFAQIPGNTGSNRTMAQVIQFVQDAGGISHLNHPGRYTGAQNNAALSSNPIHVNRYVQLFMDFPSLVGVEIINKWDGESINDRILWDNILVQTAPEGRFVWGFSNDDSHSLSGNGHAWNVMLMPTFDEAAVRTSMETGAFYGVSRVDRQHLINHRMPGGATTPGAPAQTTTTATQFTGGTHNSFSLQMLTENAPTISNIIVDGNSISISGTGFNRIVWIADGVVVHTGNSLDVSKVSGINSYVRAELVGAFGVAYTQPFGISEATIVNTAPAASVRQVPGNTNFLTVNVTETYSNGMTNAIAETIEIRNNASGIYEVGPYKVFVDTKGNTQIREIYIVR